MYSRNGLDSFFVDTSIVPLTEPRHCDLIAVVASSHRQLLPAAANDIVYVGSDDNAFKRSQLAPARERPRPRTRLLPP